MYTPSIEERKKKSKELANDKQLYDLLLCYLRLAIDIRRIMEEEKTININEQYIMDKSINKYLSISNLKTHLLDQQLNYFKNLIIKKIGVSINVLDEWGDLTGNHIFETCINQLIDNGYNYENNFINKFYIERLVSSLVNLDLN
ncbi:MULTISPECIES: hypothetical protein [Bacillota]|uniref:hypothetical protein n=1 Tax=Bacillota TaxID=1239 RepID=UPI0039EE0A17